MVHFSVGRASIFLGVSVASLRRWDKSGYLPADYLTAGGHRRYSLASLRRFVGAGDDECGAGRVVLYARVSSGKQKDDLERQKQALREFSKDNGDCDFDEISDIGSGINFKKRGFTKLVSLVMSGLVSKIVVMHRDRLCRFGFDFFEKICLESGVSLVVAGEEREISREERMVQDLLAIVTVYSCRSNGLRSAGRRRKAQAPEL